MMSRANPNYDSQILNAYANIDYDGTVTLRSLTLFSAICEVDVLYYPFDQHICEMSFSSWAFDINMVRKQPVFIERENVNFHC